MKVMMTVLLAVFIGANMAQAECEQFPQQDGFVSQTFMVDGYEYTFEAEFSAHVTESTTSHSYDKPIFKREGQDILVTRQAAAKLFQAMGYEGLEYTLLMPAPNGFLGFGRPLVLDANLEIVKAGEAGRSTTVLDPEGYALPYHSTCANWRY